MGFAICYADTSLGTKPFEVGQYPLKKNVYTFSLQEAIEQVPDKAYREELEYQFRLYNELYGPKIIKKLQKENSMLQETIEEQKDEIDSLYEELESRR